MAVVGAASGSIRSAVILHWIGAGSEEAAGSQLMALDSHTPSVPSPSPFFHPRQGQVYSKEDQKWRPKPLLRGARREHMGHYRRVNAKVWELWCNDYKGSGPPIWVVSPVRPAALAGDALWLSGSMSGGEGGGGGQPRGREQGRVAGSCSRFG